MTMRATGSDGHLTATALAAYLHRSLTRDQRLAIESHLEQCDQCRREWIDVGRMVRSQPVWRRWYVLGPSLSAAAALILLLALPRAPRTETTPSIRAPSDGEGITSIAIVAPEPGTAMQPASLQFLWHAVGPDATYRFTLSEPDGTPVWSSETRDTLVVLPTSVDLASDHDYFWFVDAILPDGNTARTGVKSFHTTR